MCHAGLIGKFAHKWTFFQWWWLFLLVFPTFDSSLCVFNFMPNLLFCARFEKFKNMDKMDSLSSETSTGAGGQKSTVENHEMDFWGLVKLNISLQSSWRRILFLIFIYSTFLLLFNPSTKPQMQFSVLLLTLLTVIWVELKRRHYRLYHNWPN